MESQTFVLPSDGATLVTLTRHAGVEVAAQLHDQLLSAEVSAPVQIDWSQAEHLEACVLQVLLACRYDDVARGQLTIGGDNPDVRKYLELSGSSFSPVNTQSSANPSAAMCHWRPEISTWKSGGMEPAHVFQSEHVNRHRPRSTCYSIPARKRWARTPWE
jgi:hypothetical protein